jgi:hypothetical protein
MLLKRGLLFPDHPEVIDRTGYRMEHVQEHRRANLRTLLGELTAGGLSGLDAQAAFLITSGVSLKNMLARAVIGDRFARNAEWTMHRREGWLDEDHGADPF